MTKGRTQAWHTPGEPELRAHFFCTSLGTSGEGCRGRSPRRAVRTSDVGAGGTGHRRFCASRQDRVLRAWHLAEMPSHALS